MSCASRQEAQALELGGDPVRYLVRLRAAAEATIALLACQMLDILHGSGGIERLRIGGVAGIEASAVEHPVDAHTITTPAASV